MLQVFESSADHLNREQFIEFCAPYLKDIRSGVRKGITEKNLEQVPMVSRSINYNIRESLPDELLLVLQIGGVHSSCNWHACMSGS